jgi:hypothetical protein
MNTCVRVCTLLSPRFASPAPFFQAGVLVRVPRTIMTRRLVLKRQTVALCPIRKDGAPPNWRRGRQLRGKRPQGALYFELILRLR